MNRLEFKAKSKIIFLKLLTAVLLITQEELQIAVAQEPGIIKYSLVMMALNEH